MPPIGRADHDIVLVEYDIKAKRVLQSPRKVFLYKRADMQGLKDHMLAFADRFMSQDFAHVDVNEGGWQNTELSRNSWNYGKFR